MAGRFRAIEGRSKLEAAKLWVSIGADVADFTKKLDLVSTSAKHAMSGLTDIGRQTAAGLDDAAKAAGRLGDSFKANLAADLVADGFRMALGAVTDFVGGSISHLGEVEQLMAQTGAAIASTGGAAGVTADQISDMANAIEETTGVSGEMIQKGENLLLTFTNVKNAAGAGNDVFNQTTKIMADMSVALGQDASASAMQLGKALNDPIKGVTALQRVGVSFTAAQKDTIKALQDTGHTMDAQKLILAELTKEFGGSAEAFGKTWPGVLGKAEAAWEGLGDSLLGPLVPAFKAGLTSLSNVVIDLSKRIGKDGLTATINDAFGPTTKAVIVGLGAATVVAMLPSLAAVKAAAISTAISFAPLIATAAAVAFAARPIIKYWDQLPSAFSAVFGMVESTMLSWYQTVRTVANNVWKAFKAAADNIGAVLGPAFSSLKDHIGRMIEGLPAEVRDSLGSWGAAFNDLAVTAGNAVATIPGMVTGSVKRMGSAIGSSVSGIGNEFAALGQIGGTFMEDMKGYINSFAGDAAKAIPKISQAGDEAARGMGKAGHAAKGAGDAMKRAAEEAKQAMEHIGAGLRGIVDLTKFAAIPGALKDMNRGLDAVADHAKSASAGFNEWAETAKVLAGTLKKLDAAGLRGDTGLYRRIAADLEVATRAAERFQQGQDALGKVFEDTSRAIATAEAKASIYGSTFDLLGAQIRIHEQALDQLAELGYDRASAAVQFHLGKLTELQAQLPPTTTAFEDFKLKMEGTAQAVGSMREGLATLGGALGATFLDPILTAASQVFNLGLAATQVIAAAPQVVSGITAIGAAVNMSLGPIGLIAVGLGAVVVAALNMGKGVEDGTGAANRSLSENEKKTVSWAKKTSAMMLSVANGADEMGAHLTAAMKGLKIAPVNPATFQRIFDEADRAAEAIKVAETRVRELDLAIANLKVGFFDSFKSSVGGAIKGFLDGTKTLKDGLRTGIRDAIASGITDALIQKQIIEQQFGDLITNLSKAIAETGPASSAVDKAIEQIGQRIPAVAGTLEATMSKLKATLDKAFKPMGDQVSGILDTRSKAFADISFKANTLGSLDAAGALGERISATEKAMTDLRAAGAQTSNQFGDLGTELARFREQLAAIKAADAAKKATKGADKAAEAIAAAYAPAISALQASLTKMANTGQQGSAAWNDTLGRLHAIQAEMNVPALASGGLTSGATMAMIGEAGPEAVLPLNDAVYARLGRGIAESGGGGGGVTVVVQYTGSGKWTRQDARELGGLIVNELRAAGVRP